MFKRRAVFLVSGPLEYYPCWPSFVILLSLRKARNRRQGDTRWESSASEKKKGWNERAWLREGLKGDAGGEQETERLRDEERES